MGGSLAIWELVLVYESDTQDLSPATNWTKDWGWLDDQWGANAIDILNDICKECPVATGIAGSCCRPSARSPILPVGELGNPRKSSLVCGWMRTATCSRRTRLATDGSPRSRRTMTTWTSWRPRPWSPPHRCPRRRTRWHPKLSTAEVCPHRYFAFEGLDIFTPAMPASTMRRGALLSQW